MMRPPVSLSLLFAVPFVVYALFVWFRHRKVFERAYWRLKTVMSLTIVGLLLMIGNLVYLSQFIGWAPGTVYEPARLEDGKIVPGRTR